MKSAEIRKLYLEFFKSKGHEIIPSAPVVPENDPTVLFTTAGMHPLVPYLMGEKHPKGTRLANVQKCVRTDDIDEVGDRTHHTFFEMMGNWSLGDYFKKEAIEWSWEFLTSKDWLGLDPKLIACSVFAGDDDAPFDQEAHDVWISLGMPEEKIARLPKKNNWWGPAGQTGPCGPDSEMFYWTGNPDEVPTSFNDDNDLWVEIWNDVFMEYNKKADGTYEKLAQQNVDTGMGLERISAVMQKAEDNFKTDLFWPIVEKIQDLCGKKYGDDDEVKKSMRIIADHIKAAVFMAADGVEPSNVERGYVMRRLIRRAIRRAKALGIENNFTLEIIRVVKEAYSGHYAELDRSQVEEWILKEEDKFRTTLSQGIKKLEKFIDQDSGSYLDKVEDHKWSVKDTMYEALGKIVFDLYQTNGFPIELTLEEFRSRGIRYDEHKLKMAFEKELKKHQDLSRTASAGMFKGGLADTREKTTQLHTAAHLMLAGLRKVLGDHVHQKGSNINGERIRFDFSHPDKLTDEQKKSVEDYVNEAIGKKVDVEMEEMPLAEARSCGAEGAFENKYGDVVKVYRIDGYSNEICGGPHVANTGDIEGVFRIKKEESSGSGVRRIKAVIE